MRAAVTAAGLPFGRFRRGCLFARRGSVTTCRTVRFIPFFRGDRIELMMHKVPDGYATLLANPVPSTFFLPSQNRSPSMSHHMEWKPGPGVLSGATILWTG